MNLPPNNLEEIQFLNDKTSYEFLIIIPIVIGVLVAIYLKKQNQTKP